MPGGTRRVVVMRHAKAEQAGTTDFDRVLTARGRADAGDAGRWLAELDFSADAALVSAAARTRETWAALAGAAGFEVEPDYSDPLYSADADSAVDLVRRTPDDVAALVVIGHNPTMSYVATDLDDGNGERSNDLVMGFPTAALAVFEHAGPWSDLGSRSARLLALYVGRA